MKFRLPLVSLALAIAALAAHFLPGAAGVLEYERHAAAQGEMWRWFTAHIAHFDRNHLVWDVVVLIVLGWATERQSRARTATAMLLAAPAITLAVACFQPQFATYRGLSGIDSALFGLLAGWLLRRDQAVAVACGGLAIAAMAAKCSLEIATGSTLFAEGSGYAPVPLAHLIGLAAGLGAAFLPRPRIIFRRRAAC